MTNKELVESFDICRARITEQMNQALIDIDGETHLPFWLQRYVSAPVFSISADTLQGIKIGLKIATWKLKELSGKEIDKSRREKWHKEET